MKNYYLKKTIPIILGFIISVLFSMGCLATPQTKVWNLSDKNIFFVGREEKLAEIHSFFERRERRTLALTGGPGFGKSQIAKKFAQKFEGDYDLIWWFDVQQDIPSQFERLTVALNTLLPAQEKIIPSTMSKESLIDQIKNTLRIKNIRYLFIFDGAENFSNVEKYIPYVHNNQSNKHVLLTSRNPNVWVDIVEIGKFKREESLQLIKTALPKAKDNDVDELAKTLSDHALGLTLAIGIIKSSPTMTIPKYLAIHMSDTFTHKAKEQNVMMDTYPNDIERALLIGLKAIEKDHKDALPALYFMSLLNSKDIPEHYIESWLKKTGSSLISDEAIKYIFDQSLVGVSDTAEFHEKGQTENGQVTHYLSMHDHIHQLINEKLSDDEKKKLLYTATDVLLDVFAGRTFEFIKKIIKEPIHLLHAQKLCENAQKIGYSSPKLLQLKVCMFEFLMSSLRDFEGAKVVLEDIEKDRKQGFQLEPYYEAHYKINKAFFESVRNANYTEAISTLSEGLAILTSTQQYYEERLRAISNLAQYHALSGEINKSIKFIDEGKEIFEKSKSEYYNSFYLFNWSFVLTDQGKFKEAMDVLHQAKITPQLIADHPTLYHALLLQQIELLIKQRRLEEAQKNLEEYEKIMKKFYEERYKAYVGLGNILYLKSMIALHNGTYRQEINQWLSDAIKLYNEKLRGEKKNRFQARTHLALGKAHAMNKDYKEALKEYLFSEGIYDLIFKEKNMDDLGELYAELALLGVQMKDEGLSQKYLTAHIETFSLDHPRTEKILKGLDGVSASR